MLENHITSSAQSNPSFKSKHPQQNKQYKTRKRAKAAALQEQVYCSDEESAPPLARKGRKVTQIDQLIAQTQNQVIFPIKLEPPGISESVFPRQTRRNTNSQMIDQYDKQQNRRDEHLQMDQDQPFGAGAGRKKKMKKKITTTLKITPCNPILQTEQRQIKDAEFVQRRVINDFKRKIAKESEGDYNSQKSEIMLQIPIHLQQKFQAFFQEKVNISYKSFLGHLKKKKANFLTNAQISNIIINQKKGKRTYKKKEVKNESKKQKLSVQNTIHEQMQEQEKDIGIEGKEQEVKARQIQDRGNSVKLENKQSIGISVNLYEEFPIIPVVKSSQVIKVQKPLQFSALQPAKDTINTTTQNEKNITKQKQKLKSKQKARSDAFPLKIKHFQMNPMSPQNQQNIKANIDYVNRQCQKEDKMYRMMNELQEKQRSEKDKKSAKKEPVSAQPSQASVKQEEYEMSQRRREQYQRNFYSRNHHKNKRLEILNRYHYNPFEETDGDDQCQLWKRLMTNQILKIKNNAKDYRSQAFAVQHLERMVKGFGSIESFRGSDIAQITQANFKIPNSYVRPKVYKKDDQEDKQVQQYLDLGIGQMKRQDNLNQFQGFPNNFDRPAQIEVKAETDIYGINVQESDDDKNSYQQEEQYSFRYRKESSNPYTLSRKGLSSRENSSDISLYRKKK